MVTDWWGKGAKGAKGAKEGDGRRRGENRLLDKM